MNRLKRISYTLCLCVLAFSTSAVAQVPGYLGKKNTFRVGVNSSVSINGETGFCNEFRSKDISWVYDETPECNVPGANLEFSGAVSRAISKGISLTLEAKVFKSSAIGAYSAIAKENTFDTYDRFEIYCLEKISAQEIKIGTQLFVKKSGAIAPMGSYFGFSAGIGRYSSSLADSMVKPDYFLISDPVFYEFYTDRPSRMYPIIGMEIGANTILNDFLLLNINVQASIPLNRAVLGTNDYYGNPYDLYDGSDQEVINYYRAENSYQQDINIGNRIANRGAIMLGVNIGFVY